MKVTIELTDSEIEAILVTAGRGCAYWAVTQVSLCEALQQPIQVWDRELWYDVPPDNALPAVSWELTPAMLRKAATRMAYRVQNHRCDPSLLMQLLQDPECVDEPTADAFVQCALFGKIRFG